MKLVRYRHNGTNSWGVLEDGLVAPMAGAWATMPEALAEGGESIARAMHAVTARIAVSDLVLLKPVEQGVRIFCIGLNYAGHVAETAREAPQFPSVFLRTHESLVGPGDTIVLPLASSRFDFEAELAVVIGVGGRRIRMEDADKHIAGYTCMGEHSVRDFQRHNAQVTPGKNFDGSGAIGPWITTADAVPDPASLQVLGRLNGNSVQQGHIGDLIYPIARLIAYISEFTSLRPGDVIATGTPAGVGATRVPPLFMTEGDRFEVEIPGVGSLVNLVVPERSLPSDEATQPRAA
ncbi:fumarylacetoacetate hydrolase family protein [Cupriavidus lacunae]|uniref:5-carboxymethyl-2-hydroxymuconate isomerase n=1 Tax=Cupriavidus lacunae TaxID=2666307 RepID=A0A370NR79_9BURK|nr:fumarylacetoacetate hydrolase family protein [Cupriavidus lacunae]RDK08116.1 5-carboxymethyl-2-hydroxymuconate isomerase [Cupriavidus lacunae]